MDFLIENNTISWHPGTDLVASCIESQRDQVLNQLQSHPDIDTFVMDAAGVEIIDSMGVNLIIGLYRELSSQSKTFQIVDAGESFMKVANFFKFPSLFDVAARASSTA